MVRSPLMSPLAPCSDMPTRRCSLTAVQPPTPRTLPARTVRRVPLLTTLEWLAMPRLAPLSIMHRIELSYCHACALVGCGRCGDGCCAIQASGAQRLSSNPLLPAKSRRRVRSRNHLDAIRDEMPDGAAVGCAPGACTCTGLRTCGGVDQIDQLVARVPRVAGPAAALRMRSFSAPLPMGHGGARGGLRACGSGAGEANSLFFPHSACGIGISFGAARWEPPMRGKPPACVGDDGTPSSAAEGSLRCAAWKTNGCVGWCARSCGGELEWAGGVATGAMTAH